MAQEVFVDLTRKGFVASLKGAPTSQPYGTPYHQDILNLSIQPVDYRSGGVQSSNPYEVLDASGYSISLLITKASDGSTLVGPVTAWSPIGTALVGSVDLNTGAMGTATSGLSAGGTLETIFWLRITNGSTRQATVQTSVTIYKNAIISGTPTELPLTRYATLDDLNAFVRFANNPPGATVTLTSPSGTSELILGANDDDSAAANLG